MRMNEVFYNNFMYLYNKKVLEYAQITRNGTESKIPYIEGRSIMYVHRTGTSHLLGTRMSKKSKFA